MNPRFLTELDRVGQTLRRTAQRTALRWWLVAAIGGGALLVEIDAVGRFTDPGLRWVFTGMWLAVVGWAAWRVRRVAAIGATDALAVARRVETANAALGSRLSSAVAFAASNADDSYAGSAELRRAVVVGADLEAEGIDFGAVVDRRPLRRAGRSLAAVGGVAALLAVVGPGTALTGLARLAAPWSDLPWPRRNHLQLVERVTTLPLGSALEVAAIDERGELPDDVRIEYRVASSEGTPRVESAPMSIVGREAVARRDDVRKGFAYRVVGGDDQTMEWVELAVVDPPRVTAITINATPPAYTGLKPTGVDGALRVVEGTTLSLTAEVNEGLESAAVELPAGERIDARLIEGQGDAPWKVAIDAADWVARAPQAKAPAADAKRGAATLALTASTYRLVLKGNSGIDGGAPPRPYEVLADAPPRPEWQSPTGDTFVTAKGLVPLKVAAVDDLAVRGIAVRWSAESPPPGAGDVEAPPRQRNGSVLLADYGADPPPREALGDSPQAVAELEWDVAELALAPGARLELVAVAGDYKPQEGRAALPRRVTVVTDEEFDSLLGEKQSRLLAEVQRAVDRQRDARDRGVELLADVDAGKPLDRTTVDRLASLEFEQRAAEGIVADPARGAAKLARELVDELRRSRLERPELAEQLATAGASLDELAQGLLADTRRELGAARRAAERPGPERSEVGGSLRSAAGGQATAVERLEQIAQGLTGWSDFQRFADELAELARRQEGLAAATATEAAAAAQRANEPLGAVESKAERGKLLGAQAETGRRFSKLAAAMQGLLDEAAAAERQPGAADAVEDALAEGRDRDVAGTRRDASRDLALGRTGRAAAAQDQAAEGLKSMLEALRQRAPSNPEELAAALREAAERLAKVQQQTDEIAKAPRPDQQAASEAAKEAERVARRLKRLTAPKAGQNAQQGAKSLAGGDPSGAQSGGQSGEGQQGKQGGKSDPQQAQEQFDRAQREIAKRLDQLEDQIVQRLLDQLRERIDGMVKTQREVLQQTLRVEADAAGETPEGRLATRVAKLAKREGSLGEEVAAAAAKLSRRAVFEVALRGAADELEAAAALLNRRDVGRDTQRREADALGRLKHVADVLRDNQQQQKNQQQGDGGGEGAPGKPSPVDVAELKMLRLMQLELIARTDNFEADVAAALRQGRPAPPDGPVRAERLAAEQRALAELALEMTRRNNDPDAPQAP
ncbi:MAG: hypothetical protein ACRCT8_02720 [Lacipirellulaceae bacterium]